jgi:predicted ATPase
MKLVEVKVKGFRCFKEETCIAINDMTAFIGKNDAGKSTIMEALAIFFETQKIDSGDLNVHAPDDSVTIICVFENFPASIVIDAENETTLENEHLLNSDGRLEIVKRYKCTEKPSCSVSVKARHPSNKNSEDLLSMTIQQLRKRVNDLKIDDSGTDTRKSADLRKLIWDSFNGNLVLADQELEIDGKKAKEDARGIWEQIKRYLPVFAIFKSDRSSTDQDSEAQDPMVMAVKQAINGQQATLNTISEKVQQEVEAIAQKTIRKLEEIQPGLAKTLKPNFKPPKWDSCFKMSLTGDEDIPINKRGSGVRRLILLSFFRAKVEQETDNSQNAIYAIEEPETSQHPDYQKMLFNSLLVLSEQPNCQVLISTHTPMLVGIIPVESIRYIEVGTNGERSIREGDEETYHLITNALGVLPDNRVQIFVAVEGTNDISFMNNMSRILHAEDPEILDLEDMVKHDKLIYVPLGGGNLQLWTSRLAPIKRPEFHIYDRDEGQQTRKHKEAVDKVNARGGNCHAVLTGMREMENYIHPEAIKDALGIDVKFTPDDDVPICVAKALHDKNGSDKKWDELIDDERKRKEGKAKKRLNSDATAKMTLPRLKEIDPNNEVIGWFKTIAKLASSQLSPISAGHLGGPAREI